MLEILFSNIGLPRILEFVAALAATFSYIFKKNSRTKIFKYLLSFLWITVIIELIGSYARLAEPYCFEDFSFFKEYPLLLKNYWVYNIYSLIAYTFYAWYFLKQLNTKKNDTIGKYSIIFFNVISIIHFISNDVFFTAFSQFVNLIGLILIVLMLFMYYYELLKTERILSITKSLPFYISIGVLIFYISVTPLLLSSEYIKPDEILFLKYYRLILNYANYFLYGIIIFGIIKCYWFNKSQSMKSSSSPTLL